MTVSKVLTRSGRLLFTRASDGMDAGVEATQEQFPNARSKSPASARGLGGLSTASAKWGRLRLFTFLGDSREVRGNAPPQEDAMLSILKPTKHHQYKSNDQSHTATANPGRIRRGFRRDVPGRHRAARSARWSVLPRPSAHTNAAAWWRCRSRHPSPVRRHR
jgi:hypothetical protein